MVVATDDGGEKVITMEDVVCSECGKGTDDELMLLCDGCPTEPPIRIAATHRATRCLVRMRTGSAKSAFGWIGLKWR